MSVRESQEWTLVSEWAGTVGDLSSAAALSAWDRETLMPPAGSAARARQQGTLAALHHRETVRADAGEALARLSGRPDLAEDPHVAAFVRVATRMRDRAVRLPESLVRETSEACAESVHAWTEARERDDFAHWAGPLARVLALRRQEADALEVGDEPYDALLDAFEPDTRVAGIEPVLADLRERLGPLVEEAGRRPEARLPAREWDTDAQVRLAHELADMVGFDLRAGVIARSVHPFTSTTHRGDVRFTTRVDPASPISSIGAVMHEVGHALYEQGFAEDLDRTPLHDAPSLAAHESQSRFWENHVGRTRAFWNRIEPTMRRLFPEAMEGVDADLMHRAANVVRPSPIRVEADEVTYHLHIVLRTELEVAMVRGDLAVTDLPGAFSDGMDRLLGVRPATGAEGAMQDIHWAEGLFGYFPTYTLGSLYSAQLAEAADQVLDGLEEAVEEGRFREILDVMRHRIHRHGATVPTPELMHRATGRTLSADALIAHLGRTHTG
ncbi:MAG: carboxypeptidase M32 [Acidimicrobiales bacterium]